MRKGATMKVTIDYQFTTQEQVRAAFWQGFTPELKRLIQWRRGKRQNEYLADVRMEWVDFVDMLQKDGHISENLAASVTL